MKYKQIDFKGLMVEIDLVDMPPENTPDCENVDLDTRGELNNAKGMEKQHTSAKANDVTAIHQLGTDTTQRNI